MSHDKDFAWTIFDPGLISGTFWRHRLWYFQYPVGVLYFVDNLPTQVGFLDPCEWNTFWKEVDFYLDYIHLFSSDCWNPFLGGFFCEYYKKIVAGSKLYLVYSKFKFHTSEAL